MTSVAATKPPSGKAASALVTGPPDDSMIDDHREDPSSAKDSTRTARGVTGMAGPMTANPSPPRATCHGDALAIGGWGMGRPFSLNRRMEPSPDNVIVIASSVPSERNARSGQNRPVPTS